jgi:hypothetical protein
LVWAVALSVGSVIVSGILMRSLPHGAARTVIALLPVPFFIAFVFAQLSWIRASDEFHKAVMLESLAIAFPSAITLAVVIEAVQKAGYATSWTVGDIWPWMALLWLPAIWIALRRFR